MAGNASMYQIVVFSLIIMLSKAKNWDLIASSIKFIL